ncbi:MAG: poly-beta-1,6-N-acetyl-D-glucosamine N-deacetylase PgaB [Steroidobacteraceae bacterium]|jgi:biofilm PGA synthesis lipoprotein PgaB
MFFRRLFLTVALLMASAWAHAEPRPNLTVIGYHEIADAKSALIPDYAVTPTMFVRQIDWLRNNGFHFVSVDDVLADRAGLKRLPDKAVLLTFDDGYRSVYDHAWPILKMFKIPAVVAVVGKWEESVGTVDFDGHTHPRDYFMTWDHLREMTSSGLVEVASHSFDQHRGIVGNPQGNRQPATVTRQYDKARKSYESESDYERRMLADLKANSDLIRKHVGRAPRVMAWPFGRYNRTLREAAIRLGMPIGLNLEDGANTDSTPLWGLRRILIEHSMNLWDLSREIKIRNLNLTDNDRPQKIAHVDLDFIYDEDEAQQERNLGHLLDRLTWLGVTTVYLQAYSDPDANGSADSVYFPNRHVPMRADLFNRVAWQIRTRTQVKRLYAWMPLLAWDLPATSPAARDMVVTLPSEKRGHLNMGYRRLSPFSPTARRVIRDVYEDLARSVQFDGLLFHDDVTLSDYEDASTFGLAQYRAWGLPGSIEQIRGNDDLLGRWTILKINALDNFAMEMADVVRLQQPALVTARNLYAQVALNPRAEVWYSQAYENSLARYDFTAIMAMPYMENAPDPKSFYAALVERAKERPNGLRRTVFELQVVDWRHDQKEIPTDELVETVKDLYKAGALHVGYYPDMLFENHPNPAKMRAVFSLKDNNPEVD